MHSAGDTTSGIYTLSLDGTDFFSKDTYHAGGIQFDMFASGSIVVSSAGMKALRLRANGKNPSSSDVFHYITEAVCRRIA